MDTGLIGRLEPAAPPLTDEQVARACGRSRCDRRRAAGDDPFERRDGWRLGGVRAPSYWRLSVDGGEPLRSTEARAVRIDADSCARRPRFKSRAAVWSGTRAGRGR